MALGGGTFSSQNKVLPGTYLNFVSAKSGNINISDRGVATMPLVLDWGIEGEVFEVTSGILEKQALVMFGYHYSHDKLKGIRDLFQNLEVLYGYRMNGGVKAKCEFATAKYSGIRGNDLRLSIEKNIDDATYFDVSTLLDGEVVDVQVVQSYGELVANEYVVFDQVGEDEELLEDLVELPSDEENQEVEEEEIEVVSLLEKELYEVLALPFSGGSNGIVTLGEHQSYLDKIENYTYNVLGVVTEDEVVKNLYGNFTKRMRNEVGAKFQLVVHELDGDDEGIINVVNKTTDDGWSAASMVYFVTGLQAGCEVNKSCLNRLYEGEFSVSCEYTQSQSVEAISQGKFVLHQVGFEVRVLADINSLVSLSEDKGELFQSNQTLRVMDKIANDIAVLFNSKYLGNIPNDESGRISLWSDIVKHHEQLQEIRAIENFSASDVIIEQGESKTSIVVSDVVQVVNAMEQLYMSVEIK